MYCIIYITCMCRSSCAVKNGRLGIIDSGLKIESTMCVCRSTNNVLKIESTMCVCRSTNNGLKIEFTMCVCRSTGVYIVG